MRFLYGVMSQGQGHINRSAVVIDALRRRGHTVDVQLVGHAPPPYAAQVLGRFDFAPYNRFVLRDGRLAVRETVGGYLRHTPGRRWAIRRLARQIARRRYDCVISDFEAVTAAAARRAGCPVVGVAGQYRITRTDCPGPRAPVDRTAALIMMNAWTPGLDDYYAVSFSPARATRRDTHVIGPLVGADVRARTPSHGGFRLAYLYTYPIERIVEVLRGHGPFRVYGKGIDEQVEDIRFCHTSRDGFLDDLAACEGVLLNGSFQAVCEAATLSKPMLSIPFAGQYEERFNAHLIDACGLGHQAPTLTWDAIGRWIAESHPPPAPPPDGAATLVDRLGA